MIVFGLKSINMKFLIPSVVLLFLFSCGKESFDNSSQGLIKRKLFFRNINDTSANSVDEYHYNLVGQLKEISSKYRTQLFYYNRNNYLEARLTYNISGENKIISDSTFFRYESGQLISEETTYPPNREQYKIIYEYNGSELFREKHYLDGVFLSMTAFEYVAGRCRKESVYTDSLGIQLSQTVEYAYDKNELSMKTLRLGSGTLAGTPILVTYYHYDGLGNLLLEYGVQVEGVVNIALEYCYRFEYY